MDKAPNDTLFLGAEMACKVDTWPLNSFYIEYTAHHVFSMLNYAVPYINYDFNSL